MISVVDFARSILGNLDLAPTTPSSWLAAISPKDGSYRGLRYDYPQELEAAIETFVPKYRDTHNMYICVNTTDSPLRRVAEYVSVSNVIYADLDNKIHPARLLVSPTYILRTSSNKHQAFWVLDKPVSAEETSRISRQIATFHGLDPCWDKVRLMRLPDTLNFKYTNQNSKESPNTQTYQQSNSSTYQQSNSSTQLETPPFEVKIIYSSNAKYRISDFRAYPRLPEQTQLRYINVNVDGEDKRIVVSDEVKYDELDPLEQNRIDEYTESAVDAELLKLASLEILAPGDLYYYTTNSGILEGYGWDAGCMWVASCLVELANSNWNNYTLDQAYSDFMTNAPTDNKFTKHKLYEKWKNAYIKCHVREIKVRPYPQDINAFTITQETNNTTTQNSNNVVTKGD